MRGIARKVRQIVDDPVLRRWMLRSMFRSNSGVSIHAARTPPYLASSACEPERRPFTAGPASPSGRVPGAPVDLWLPGRPISLQPDDPGRLFDVGHDDTERMLAVHRFAWLPVMEHRIDAHWVARLWSEWRKRFSAASSGWAWHPYTAAERAINILNFAQRVGLPGDDEAATQELLARHGDAILNNLEYFGDSNTSNHLANNGRGLYAIGLSLGLEKFSANGANILVNEAKRIFLPSGVLREASSHYHMLLTRTYADAWLLARRFGRREAAELEGILRRAVGVVPHLMLPGGMPRIGDVSPDCPVDHLAGLVPLAEQKRGWLSLLSEADYAAFTGLRDSAPRAESSKLTVDGWTRVVHGPWSALWYLPSDGWTPFPGHGHEDQGGFELHFADEPVFRDLGRRSYGASGQADVQASSHNVLIINDQPPSPPNRPYYDRRFREEIIPRPSTLTHAADRVRLRHHGYERLGDVGALVREWVFSERNLCLVDCVEGRGRQRMTRYLHTTLPVEHSSAGILMLKGRAATYRLEVPDGALRLEDSRYWPDYGCGVPATSISIDLTAALPWESRLSITVC